MLSLLVGAWLSISPIQGQSDTTSVVVIEWWHTISQDSTFDINLYTITDSVKIYKKYAIIKIDSLLDSEGWAVPNHTYLYGLITERLPYKKMLYCFTEKYGYDYFYNWGFVPNIIPTPTTGLGKGN